LNQLLGYLKGDKVIWIITLLFLSLSLVSVYSFVPILVKTEGGTPFKYLFKHLIYIILGLLAMYWIHKQDSRYIAKLSKFAFYLAVFLLVFTFFFGVKVNDAARWIRVPIVGLTFQTSDFAKLALVIYLSRLMVKKEEFYHSWKEGFWPIVLPVLVICGLIAKDNFSTAAIVFMIALTMMFIGRVPVKKILAFIGGGIAALGLVVLTHLALPALNLLPRFDTWMARFFRAYGENIDHVNNAQAINAELAIHSGGYFGVGVGSGKLKQYLPEAYADFYYSSFVEEFGMVMAVILIFLYLILFYRILRIALNAEKLFETYMCVGIGLLIMSQSIINMMVCTGLMPVTGQNMPFLAMGGSAMIMSCVSLGIVLAVANKSNPENSLNPVNEEKDGQDK
jgi:cell division protein FtsW